MDQRMEASWQTDRRACPPAPTAALSASGTGLLSAPVSWLFPALLALGAGLAACKDPAPPGVRVDLEVEDEAFRPQFVRFHWLRPGRKPFEERLPEAGDFTPTQSNPFASLFVQTVGPLHQPRGLALRGYRGGQEVSGAVLGIPPSAAEQRRLRVVLGEPLPDLDGNGVPDVVDGNCFGDTGPKACPPDEGEVTADAGAEAGSPDVHAPPDATIDLGPVSEGLIGFWRFDEGSGTTAGDSSGHGNQGMLRGSGLVWAPGRAGGGSLEIPNQQNHGVLVAPSPTIDAVRQFTIAVWLYRQGERTGLANVLSRRSFGSSEYYALAVSSEGYARVYLNSQSSPRGLPLSSPAAIPLDSWTHLAATYDGSEVRLYVNGAMVESTEADSPIDGKATALCLGCGQNGDNVVSEPATGRLDDLRFYNRALSDAEVAAIAR
jgi:hypothetical protein